MRRAMIIAALTFLVLVVASLGRRHTTRAETEKAVQCQYVVTPTAQSFAARGGAGSLSVLAAGNCGWTAVSNTPWLNIASGNSGSGVGRVNYSVVANPNPNQRTGLISIAGLNVIITQAGTGGINCAVTPINSVQPVNGSLAPGDCQSPSRLRDGARPFADRYSFNASSGQPVIITLASTDFDSYLYLLGANGAVIAQNDDTGPSGNARIPSGSGFFTLPSSGTFTIEVTSFSSTGVGNYTLSLTMPGVGCTYAITPASQSFPTNGGTGAVNVSTQPECAWTAMSNHSWIMASSGGSGSGSGTVNYSVTSNGATARTGTITVAGLRFTITQSGTNGAACPVITGINPSSGAPDGIILITGTNFTGVTGVRFAGDMAAQFNVISDTQITTTIPNGATTGPLTISKPTCADAQTPSFTVNRAVTTVSAASYLGASLASESIVAAFGSGMATGVALADSLPLPTALLGTTIKVKDSAGVERLAPLFFVAPTQINYQIPPSTAAGMATITVGSGDGTISTGMVNIATVAPGLFSANASGQGVAAATVLRIKADSSQSFEPVGAYDQARNQFVPLPIDLGAASDQLFLILFGTGARFGSSPAAATCLIGDVNAEVLYAGAQGDFVGLDQANVRLPRNLIGRGEVTVVLTVDGKMSNAIYINIK